MRLKPLLAAGVGVSVCAVVSVIGLSVATSAGTIGLARDYDMAPEQTIAFVTAGTKKLGWEAKGPTAQPTTPDPATRYLTFRAPVLPWSAAEVLVSVSPKAAGSHVALSGHATKVKELEQLLSRQLPKL